MTGSANTIPVVTAERLADAFDAVVRAREGFKKVNRVAAVGVADSVFEVQICVHARQRGGSKTRSCSKFGAILQMRSIGQEGPRSEGLNTHRRRVFVR